MPQRKPPPARVKTERVESEAARLARLKIEAAVVRDLSRECLKTFPGFNLRGAGTVTATATTLPVEFDASSNASLPALVARAAETLASATTAAEVLEARNQATLAYETAKAAARFAKAQSHYKGAYDELMAKVHRTQADALEIEALAKRRLADEYDAAQERGEMAGPRDGDHRRSDRERPPAAADIGLTRKEIHHARQIRDAEAREPGIVRRTLDDRLAAGQEPTRAAVKASVKAKAREVREREKAPEAATERTEPRKERTPAAMRSDLKALRASDPEVHRELVLDAVKAADNRTRKNILCELLSRKSAEDIAVALEKVLRSRIWPRRFLRQLGYHLISRGCIGLDIHQQLIGEDGAFQRLSALFAEIERADGSAGGEEEPAAEPTT
jgi:hypothetical protein